MPNSHSLPSQRIATQLPFSPSQSRTSPTTPRRQQFTLTKPHGGNIANGTPRDRSGSVASSPSKPTSGQVSPSGEPPLTFPPILSYQPRTPTSSTHIPGISPSSSFFRPLRPQDSIPASPPPIPSLPIHRSASPGSMVSSEAHAMTPVHLPFTVQQRLSRNSDVSDSNNPSTEDLQHNALPLPSTSKSTLPKASREPLLPIGPRSPRKASGPTRPSLSIMAGPYGRSETSISPSAKKMRNSFEKLFKRRPSHDTALTPISAGPSQVREDNGKPAAPFFSQDHQDLQDSPLSPLATNARMTFETSEDGHSPLSPVARYKNSSSPGQSSSISFQQYTFNPIPPTDVHPLPGETPVISQATGKSARRFELHPSRNRFFLSGRILTGGDSPMAFIASLMVVFGITGVWFATTCVWWWINESPAVAAVGAYMCLLTISSMFATAFRDPGILPRELDPDPPYPPTSSETSMRAPLPRDLRVRAGIVRVKYCPTCRTYRPPRSSHCKMCDNCVDNCDHHCQWVNNCIGRRNYTTFFTFLFSAVLTLFLVICTTAIHLWLLTTNRFGLSFRRAIATPQGVGSAIAFSISIVVVWPVSALLAYHLRLLLLNVTTIEQIRNQAHKTLAGPPPPNPFTHGNWRRNLFYVLCRPVGYSWLDARAFATEDKREVNPGMFIMGDWQAAMEEGRGTGKGQ